MSDAIPPDVAALAVVIADEAARSVIETECRVHHGADGTAWYAAMPTSGMDEEVVLAISRAVRYLDQRGRLTRHPDLRSLVRAT